MYIYGGTVASEENSIENQQKYNEFMAKIEADEKIEADDWMPEEYRKTLIKLISMHGISEIMGALPEKEWVPKAPTLKRKLGIMAKVQDEMGHGQLLLRVTEDLMKPYGRNRVHLMEDLLKGDLKFHNVFHMPTKTWADAGVVGWLVDGAAIISQTNMLDASYGPYQRALKRICQEEVFHAQHGESIIMSLAEGTKEQREILQDSINRWWSSLLMFFGPASASTTGTSKQEVTTKYRIRKSSNEELRQAFLDKYLPRIFSLDFSVPDETVHYDKDKEIWVYQQPDWNEFKKIISNNGPRSQQRLRLREVAYTNNRWVREALA
ncbi:1,2-phenylacetyl-CoA epoxidase subunit PaaA [Halobacillus rhizosphaerae]